MLASEGWSISSSAKALRNSEASINQQLNDYLKKENLSLKNDGS
ncbi:MAG: hypothetical protein QS748_10310 [Candidatus Endonucleobacter bathymodioli]|uniref:Uncharacterized protein n=1 Tax=Candidatus Endonucleibacter bathymodioli TaxID=539814 RepID=A0AA90NS64_9GAMM|nr:hypothetical protein [Candidatus Endonucleobacter bathymodioli]